MKKQTYNLEKMQAVMMSDWSLGEAVQMLAKKAANPLCDVCISDSEAAEILKEAGRRLQQRKVYVEDFDVSQIK